MTRSWLMKGNRSVSITSRFGHETPRTTPVICSVRDDSGCDLFKMEGAQLPESPLGEEPKMAAQPTLDCVESESVKPLSLGDLSLQRYLANPDWYT